MFNHSNKKELVEKIKNELLTYKYSELINNWKFIDDDGKKELIDYVQNVMPKGFYDRIINDLKFYNENIAEEFVKKDNDVDSFDIIIDGETIKSTELIKKLYIDKNYLFKLIDHLCVTSEEERRRIIGFFSKIDPTMASSLLAMVNQTKMKNKYNDETGEPKGFSAPKSPFGQPKPSVNPMEMMGGMEAIMGKVEIVKFILTLLNDEQAVKAFGKDAHRIFKNIRNGLDPIRREIDDIVSEHIHTVEKRNLIKAKADANVLGSFKNALMANGIDEPSIVRKLILEKFREINAKSSESVDVIQNIIRSIKEK